MCQLPTHAGFRTWIAVALSVLMLGALLLRLHAVSQRIPEAPDELALHLVGDLGREDRHLGSRSRHRGWKRWLGSGFGPNRHGQARRERHQ